MPAELGYPIQRVPAGLANILGSVQHLNPPLMAGTVNPGIDLLQFYGQAQLQDRSSAAAGGIGTSALLTVPRNEWWIVYHFGMQWTTDATVTFVGTTLAMAGVPMSWKKFQNIVAAELDWTGSPRQVHHALDLGYPKVLAPGKTLNCTITDLAGSASVNFQVNALIGIFA